MTLWLEHSICLSGLGDAPENLSTGRFIEAGFTRDPI